MLKMRKTRKTDQSIWHAAAAKVKNTTVVVVNDCFYCDRFAGTFEVQLQLIFVLQLQLYFVLFIFFL